MKIKHITLLSAGAMLMLTGCYERGKVVPPSPKPKKKKEKIVYDFPVLKLSASSQIPEKKSSLDNNVTLPNVTLSKSGTSTTEIKKETREPSRPALVKEESIVPAPLKPTKLAKKKIIKKTRPKRKRKTSGHIPIIGSITSMISDISLQEVPILNQIIPKPSETSKGRIRKTRATPYRNPQNNKKTSIPVLDNNAPTPAIFNINNAETTPLNFSGGTSVTGLDMAKIRIETDNYQTNIVLDSYLWVKHNNLPTEASSVSGTYFIRYEPSQERIVALIKGYKTFSALLTKQDEMIKNNPMIKNIYIDRYVGDDGIKFIIELKKRVKVNVIDVEDPGSIIVELYPIEASK